VGGVLRWMKIYLYCSIGGSVLDSVCDLMIPPIIRPTRLAVVAKFVPLPN
jgi:hypothetical protein